MLLPASVAVLLLSSIASAQVPNYGITIADRATAAACTGNNCCIPSCQYTISGIQGCNGDQSAATACAYQLHTNCLKPFAIDMCGGYLDITSACDGRPAGIQLRGAGSKAFNDRVLYQWTVENDGCDNGSDFDDVLGSIPENGAQCAPNTGCSASEGHVGPNGTPQNPVPAPPVGDPAPPPSSNFPPPAQPTASPPATSPSPAPAPPASPAPSPGPAGPPVGGGAIGTPPSSMRIMIVGDSITHGQEGDWTWRYRISQWLSSTGIKVDFVGPYRGTQQQATPQPPQPPRLDSDGPTPDPGPRTSGGYASGANFDSDHFAVWGRQYAQDVPLIQDRVATYKPDMILVALGFNDMGWYVSDADGTLNSMKNFVANARKAAPNLQFVIANVPQRSSLGFRQDLIDNTNRYNSLLPGVLQGLSTTISPIRLADFAGNYNCHPEGCPSGYDGLHPNARGEYEIAQAFSRPLYSDFKFGSGPLQIPANIPARDVSVPRNIAATPEDMGVAVTWTAVYGIFSYTVQYRASGQSTWQTAQVFTNRYDHTYTVGGINWEFQVRSEYGDPKQGGSVGPWSGSVSAVAVRNTPPPPNDIRSSPTPDGLQVTWGSVNGSFNVDRFQVIIWDRDTPGAFIDTHAVRSSPFRATGNKGHRYDIFVSTWAGPGEGGLPASPPSVLAGGGTPATPSGLKAVNADPTSVNLSWNAVSGAAAYRVYASRDAFAGGQQDLTGTVVTTNSYGIGYMFPGTWHFRICVSALNGNLESAQTCVTPPVAPGF